MCAYMYIGMYVVRILQRKAVGGKREKQSEKRGLNLESTLEEDPKSRKEGVVKPTYTPCSVSKNSAFKLISKYFCTEHFIQREKRGEGSNTLLALILPLGDKVHLEIIALTRTSEGKLNPEID